MPDEQLEGDDLAAHLSIQAAIREAQTRWRVHGLRMAKKYAIQPGDVVEEDGSIIRGVEPTQ